MYKTISTIAALSIISVGLTACGGMYHSNERRSDMSPGSYESRESATDKYGTRTDRSTSTEVNQDRYGDRKSTTTTKTTRDPKGLFNKSTTSETKVINDQRR